MESGKPEEGRFKVIIAGGSVAGLSLALALERAGIDYELFEKGQFAPQLGASIGFYPHSLRIMDQLGVWQDIEKQVVPLRTRHHYDENGYCFESSNSLVEITEILRRPTIFMERSKFLGILHSNIRDKSKLHADNGIVEYEETANGVVVTSQDGNSHQAHILVGADGIHSRVRQSIAEKLGTTDSQLGKQLVEGFTSEYNCVFGVSRNDPSNPFLPDSMVHNVYYHTYSAIAAAGVHGLVFWFLFVKAPTQTRTPNCPRFTDDDAQALIDKYGDAQLSPGYTVRDLWDARVKATMAPLEEGVLKKWSHGRVVLMGDAVHKATINAGFGGNLAYEGIAYFTNALVPLLKEHPMPSTEQLTKVFGEYYNRHNPRAHMICDFSARITRYEAQDTWVYKFARYIIPWVTDTIKINGFVNISNGGPWLEYLPLPDIDADHCRRKPEESKVADKRVLLPSLGVAAAVVGALVIGWHKHGTRLVN
ncbi:FAD-dependent oxidoreductase [Aspergillus undulatus]|uniref:FAD-dependent oxidoreductase n=1 Tax=Aspergillus undulatus TaxID=1810928 RepID=UPI003CCD6288